MTGEKLFVNVSNGYCRLPGSLYHDENREDKAAQKGGR